MWYKDRKTGQEYKLFRVTAKQGDGSVEVRVEKLEIECYGERKAVAINAFKALLDDPVCGRIVRQLVGGAMISGRFALREKFEEAITYAEAPHDPLA